MFTSKYLTEGTFCGLSLPSVINLSAFTLDASQFVALHNAERWKKKIHLSDGVSAAQPALTAPVQQRNTA